MIQNSILKKRLQNHLYILLRQGEYLDFWNIQIHGGTVKAATSDKKGFNLACTTQYSSTINFFFYFIFLSLDCIEVKIIFFHIQYFIFRVPTRAIKDTKTKWEPYNTRSQKYLVINAESELKEKLHSKRFAEWEKHFPLNKFHIVQDYSSC